MDYQSEIDFEDLEGFEWDSGNLSKNRLKHGVEAGECEEVFSNVPLIIFADEKHSVSEKRYKILGRSISGRKLAMAVTIRNKKFRVIMARDQSKKERLLFQVELLKNKN